MEGREKKIKKQGKGRGLLSPVAGHCSIGPLAEYDDVAGVFMAADVRAAADGHLEAALLGLLSESLDELRPADPTPLVPAPMGADKDVGAGEGLDHSREPLAVLHQDLLHEHINVKVSQSPAPKSTKIGSETDEKKKNKEKTWRMVGIYSLF